ncbi:MAG: NYN domain-containing protein [Planctomycetota bacterium]
MIDAYNVLHQTGILPPRLAGLDVPGLVRLIGRSRYSRRELTLVCDGGTGTGSSGLRMGRARVLFSGREEEADDLIERLIDRYGHGGTLDVVSSDRRLRKAARKNGADSITREVFLQQLVEDEYAPPRQKLPAFVHEVPLDPYSVAHWLREFGIAEPPPEPPTKPTPPPKPAKKPKPKDAAGGTPSAWGERLQIELPEVPARPEPEPTPEPVLDLSAEQASPALELDPILRRALEEWRGRLSADDLDTGKWIDGVTPL